MERLRENEPILVLKYSSIPHLRSEGRVAAAAVKEDKSSTPNEQCPRIPEMRST